MRTERYFLSVVGMLIWILFAELVLWAVLANAQTHTMPGSNVVPSGASLTINSGASITAAAGSTVTGFGGGAVSLTATTPIIVTPSPITGTGVISLNATSKSNWDTAFSQMLQWDGGATNLVAATGRTSLALNNVTNNAQTQAAIVPNTAPAAGQILVGNAGGTAYAPQTLSGSGATISLASTGVMTISGVAGGVTGLGNPTAKVGTTAVNGSATTAMRSDGAPPIDQTVDLGMTAAQTVTVSDAVTNAVTDGLVVSHNSSAAALANYGTAIHLKGKSDTTVNRDMGLIVGAWKTPTDASRVAYMDLKPYAVTSAVTGWRVYNSGFVTNDSTTDAGAAYINANSGFRVAGSTPTNGVILQSNSSGFVASAATWPAAPGTAGYTVRSDGTNFTSYPQDMYNSSTASVASSYNADTYLVGSSVVVTAGDIKLKGQYHCVFDMAKAGAGTGIPIITVRAGTAGTTGDTAIMTFTFGAGTGVADLGVFEVWVNIRTTGASATSTGTCLGQHNLATTGIFSNAAVFTVTGAANASFNSTTATTIGLSFTGGATFTGTNTFVQATLIQ